MSDETTRPDVMARKAAYMRERRASNAYLDRTLPGRETSLNQTGSITRAFETARSPVRANELASLHQSEAERRRAMSAPEKGSRMVKQDKPHPVPRPSPHIAAQVDAAAHLNAVNQEKREADAQQQNERRVHYKQQRRAQNDKHSHQSTHTLHRVKRKH